MPQVTLEIDSIKVVQTRNGPDRIMISTSLPTSGWPYHPTGQVISFNAAQKTGAAYVREHFGIEPQVMGDTDSY